ncbi:hypothetical protein F0L17_08830 [Streptomyces sp. TRM43335]|uniref:Uncharacterized protein n=1 Tax=Streptomyces taklimakanensis TaxID=2569853 RepID=A0A6G2BAE2_9ACTN|nr:hypothetical protein [Streptomyces taklimakanensis]MTE19228.1 hypothetical protein [Streptomyces taklimakanensis]
MAGGGWTRLPDGSVVVALSVPRPGDGGRRVRFLVHAANRARALTRLRNLGLRAVYLRGNTEPPTPDEITAVLHHPDGLVWRPAPGEGGAGGDRTDDTGGFWRPVGALRRAPTG